MKIRPVEKRDKPEWMRLRRLLWPDIDEATSDTDIHRYFAADPNERGFVLIAEDDNGHPIGFAEISVRHDYVEGASTSPVAYLEGWFVDAPQRRRGVGRELVAAAEAWARARGFAEFGSDTIITNIESIAAHFALGFTEAERTVHFIKLL